MSSQRVLRRAELLLGLEGTALFRRVLDADEDFVAQRVTALRRLADPDAVEWTQEMVVPELDVNSGYDEWAPSYDSMANTLVRTEEPLVLDELNGATPGRALDAACGTGRHTAHLRDAGHYVVGIDGSPSMLAVARTNLPDVELLLGQLSCLPIETSSIDVVVCALALTHLQDPDPAIAELARVAKSGARVVISDAHPAFVLVWGQALFGTASGGLAFVRNHVHLHNSYLRSFRAHGLTVVDCREAPMEADFSTGLWHDAAAAAHSLWSDLPAVLVWTLTRDPG